MQAVDSIPDSWEGRAQLLSCAARWMLQSKASSPLPSCLSSLFLTLPLSLSQSACLCAGEGGAFSQPPLGNPSWAKKVRAPRGESGLLQKDPEPCIFSAGTKGILEPVTRKGVQSRNLPRGGEQIVGGGRCGKEKPKTRDQRVPQH